MHSLTKLVPGLPIALLVTIASPKWVVITLEISFSLVNNGTVDAIFRMTSVLAWKPNQIQLIARSKLSDRVLQIYMFFAFARFLNVLLCKMFIQCSNDKGFKKCLNVGM